MQQHNLVIYCDATFDKYTRVAVLGCTDYKGLKCKYKIKKVSDNNIAELDAIKLAVKFCEELCISTGIQYDCKILSDSERAIEEFLSSKVETKLSNLVVEYTERNNPANTYVRLIKESKRK